MSLTYGEEIVDTFAGPGGWDEALKMLGVADVLGIEWDEAACLTARAAGHQRLQADVSEIDPRIYGGKVRGLIGSPPCTLFSLAGNGVGNLVMDILAAGIVRQLAGEDCRVEIRAAVYPTTLAMREATNAKRPAGKRWTQERVERQAKDDAFVACLVLEPARWIHALGPEWVALEQVPQVLPLWQVYVRELRAMGYSAWTGVLCAADYGVPQERYRTILMAHKSMVVHPPMPTHAEHPPDGDDLFGRQLEKWVSMAKGLEWNDDDKLTAPRGAGMTERYGPRNDRVGTEPAMTITSKTRSWIRLGTQDGATVRHISEPAPTVLFGHASNDVRWHDEKPMTRAEREAAKQDWAFQRPATTVVGSFCPDVISAPGYRTSVSRQNAEGGVRVTVAEGGVLQSFRPDYPWQGSRTKQYQQVGNAIPPRLAMHVLAALGVGSLPSEVAA